MVSRDGQSAVATVLGTVGGLLLIGAGLAVLVGLISERFEYGHPEGYTGPVRLPRPQKKKLDENRDETGH
jgi:hypothetical protein